MNKYEVVKHIRTSIGNYYQGYGIMPAGQSQTTIQDEVTVVYADTMHITESGVLMFFELNEGDGSYKATRAFNNDQWDEAYEIEDEQHEISADDYANAGML